MITFVRLYNVILLTSWSKQYWNVVNTPIDWQFLQDNVLINAVYQVGLFIVKRSQYKVHHYVWQCLKYTHTNTCPITPSSQCTI